MWSSISHGSASQKPASAPPIMTSLLTKGGETIMKHDYLIVALILLLSQATDI